MSEKQQHTAASLRQKMTNRYGDELHHKHNKWHLQYRQHYRSHPAQLIPRFEQEKLINTSTGNLRALKLRKTRKRIIRGWFH